MDKTPFEREARILFGLVGIFLFGTLGFFVWISLQRGIKLPSRDGAQTENFGEEIEVDMQLAPNESDIHVPRQFESAHQEFTITLPAQWIARESKIAGAVEIRRSDESREYPRGRIEIISSPKMGKLSQEAWKERLLYSGNDQAQNVATISGVMFEVIQTVQSDGNGSDLITDGYFGRLESADTAYALFLHYQDEAELAQMREIIATFQPMSEILH